MASLPLCKLSNDSFASDDDSDRVTLMDKTDSLLQTDSFECVFIHSIRGDQVPIDLKLIGELTSDMMGNAHWATFIPP